MIGKDNQERADQPTPDRSPSPNRLLEHLGPLTTLGQEATSIRIFQDAVRKASGEPGSAGGPALVRPPELDAAPAVRRHAAAKHLKLGSTLLAAGKPRQAIAAFRQAILLDPDNPISHHDLGLACLRSRRISDAIAAFREAIALKEDYPSAYHNLGLALEESRDDIGALKAHGRAAELAPNMADAHERLGALLDRCACPDEAIESFERAAAAKPNSTTGRLARAEALRLRGQLAEAESWFHRAIARDPSNAYALRSFGIFLTNLGRLGEAAEWFMRDLAQYPTDVLAFYNLTLARKFAAADGPLIIRMTKLAEAGGLSEHFKELLHFALGKAYDDLEDRAAAMRHFDAANAFAAHDLRFDRSAFSARIDRIIAQFGRGEDADPVTSGEENATPLLPTPILIVGMPRSGTTLLEQIISSHPDVAAGGELGFWERRALVWEAALAERIAPPDPAALASDYRAALRTVSPDAPYVTDKMPNNFLWLGLIRTSFPSARIIHARRHPLDTCLSIYTKRFSGSFYSRDRASLVFYYRQYQRLMAHWRAVLPSDRFLEIDYEALVTDREAETRRLIAFLGLKWDDCCLSPERNSRLVKTASVWQVRQPVYTNSLGRWRRYEPWLGELRELLDEAPSP
ncbi:MAG TPA: sulfotransferase [Acetobacteraceae bacterium]|nr:sulfotransferase [Acetobacteraceae bacterium]